MKTLYASLHSRYPGSQSDGELSYAGYSRVPVPYVENFGDVPTEVLFPRILETVPGEITHIAFGPEPAGDGAVETVIHMLPHLKLLKDNAPRVIVTNVPGDPVPAELNPIARAVLLLVNTGQLTAADLHPAVYEAVNDALAECGIAPLPVTRAGTAHMKPSGQLH